ncbi:MAG: hypothetical protein ACOCU8_02460 [Patescibacteria group bacterium]
MFHENSDKNFMKQTAQDLLEEQTGSELSRDKAWDRLNKVNQDYRGEPLDIPLEDYDLYLEAAIVFMQAVDNQREHNLGVTTEEEKMYRLAQDIKDKNYSD